MRTEDTAIMTEFNIDDVRDITVFDSRTAKEIFSFCTWSRSVVESSANSTFRLLADNAPMMEKPDLTLTHPFFIKPADSLWMTLYIPEDTAAIRGFQVTQKHDSCRTLLFVQGTMEGLKPPMKLDVATYESNEHRELNRIHEILEHIMYDNKNEQFDADYNGRQYKQALMEIKKLTDEAIVHAAWRLSLTDDEALEQIRDFDPKHSWC